MAGQEAQRPAFAAQRPRELQDQEDEEGRRRRRRPWAPRCVKAWRGRRSARRSPRAARSEQVLQGREDEAGRRQARVPAGRRPQCPSGPRDCGGERVGAPGHGCRPSA
eukprot:15482092-Alexandrium_andersonii.AAC.1